MKQNTKNRQLGSAKIAVGIISVILGALLFYTILVVMSFATADSAHRTLLSVAIFVCVVLAAFFILYRQSLKRRQKVEAPPIELETISTKRQVLKNVFTIILVIVFLIWFLTTVLGVIKLKDPLDVYFGGSGLLLIIALLVIVLFLSQRRKERR